MPTTAFASPTRRGRRPDWLWLLMTGLALAIAGASARYVAGADMVPPPLKPNFAGHSLAFYLHIGLASLALALGPWQFLPGLRRRAPGLHRLLGGMYILACTVAGTAGLVIAPGSNGGPVAAGGFFLLALLWLGSTWRAVVAIRRRDIEAHQRWMRRSFALTLAGVTLRLYLPVSMAITGLEHFSQGYAVVAWLCWVPNLLVVEWINRIRT